MKNIAPFAALTFAFAVAGMALGYALHDKPEALSLIGMAIACIGGFAAAVCQEVQP